MTRPAADLTVFEAEPVVMPTYILAASAILRLARPSFYAFEECIAGTGGNFGDDLCTWRRLRSASRRILERGALQLSLPEACELREALKKCPPGRDVDFLRELEFNERG